MEICTGLASGAVSKGGELAAESTVKQFKYLICRKKILANMEEELTKLKGVKQAMQRRVDTETEKGYEIFPDMQDWLSRVANIEEEIQSFNANEVNKNKKCFGGMCPDLAFNYSLGKRATEKIEHIKSLKEEGDKFRAMPIISYPKAPPTLGSTFTEKIKSLESRNKKMTEVIEKLKDDKFKRIGICGMGGVGKTTLVKELIKTVEKSKLFDKVAMAVVSQNPDYEKIQISIAECLGLDWKNQSPEGRGRELLRRLKEIDVLVVLDDVWDELNFELIGLPSQDDQKGTKILFTSRDEKVCRKMGSQENVEVHVLSEDEAWGLFHEMAGDVVDKLDINPIAREVAKECGGLPLAIVTVGRALGDAEKPTWEDALEQLRNSQSSSFTDVQKFVYSRIELSFKFLGSEEHKSFLMLCGLFPEDFDIPVESLLRHGVGLRLFKGVGTAPWRARNRVHTLVGDLKKCFLLLDSDVPGCVKMHDVVRDVAISVAFKNAEHRFMVQHGIKRLEEENLNDIKAISFILDDTKELENCLECPKLELLQVMSKSKEPNPLPEHFFQGMCALKVLSMQNLCIPKLLYLSQASIHLHTLQVEGCDVGDISVIGKELKKLEILSFANSKIKKLPAEIGQLAFLRLLDLTGCDDLNFVSANVLARLSRLEELYFKVANFPWLLNKDVLKELINLSQQLKVLEIKVRKVEILPDNLTFENLERFWVYVAPYASYDRRGYLEPNVLQLRAVHYNSIKGSLMTKQLVKKCELLVLEKVKDLKNVIYELDDSGLQCMKDLRIDSCPNLEHVIDWSAPCCPFPLIKSLSLTNLALLREILHASSHHEIEKSMIGFSNLEKLKLKKLPNLICFGNAIDLNETHHPIHDQGLSSIKLTDSTNVEDGEILSSSHSEPTGCGPLFSSNWMKQFPKLETISLEKCHSLEMVFDLEGYSESNGHARALLFPQLREIEISDLDKLSYVWGNVLVCVQGFHNLRTLTISNCNSLKYVFTSDIARAMLNLEELKVTSCKSIDNLVWSGPVNEEDDNKGHETNIVFHKLYRLSLSGLPRLVNIIRSNSLKLQCPSLRQFEIDDCPVLEISLSPTHIHTNQDMYNHNATSPANTKDIGSRSFKENNSRSSLGCLPKFIRQGNTNKRSNEDVSLTPAQDPVPSNFEMKIKKEKVHMPALEDLHVKGCELMLSVLFNLKENYNFDVPSQLKTIKIEKCDKLKTIVAGTEERKHMVNCLAGLESLHLKELPNLVKFCLFGTYESSDKRKDMDECEGDHERIRRHPLMDEFLFPNLTSLVIEACNKISILFSHSCLTSLGHLEKLEVSCCESMEEILISQEEIKVNAHEIMLPRLQCLVLQRLPNLKAFCLGSYNFCFPLLQKVEIKYCPKMEVFSRGLSDTPKLEDATIEIDEPLSSDHIQNKDLNATIQGFKGYVALQRSAKVLEWADLHKKGMFGYFLKESKTKMNINAFHELLMLVPFNEIRMIQNVRRLTVSNCGSLVEVFESGRGGTKKGDATPTRYELEDMTLVNLPKLSHIWKGNITEVVSFWKLTSIYIENCHSLKSLLSHSMARSFVQLEELRVTRCKMMEEIVTKEEENTKGGSKVKILFPKLKSLSLYGLPRLECVCSGDYDYDLPLCNDEGDKKEMSNNKAQISFPQLKSFMIGEVPKLKCFCSGTYDYDILGSSIEECPKIATFPHRNVIISTPNLHTVEFGYFNEVPTLGDVNLTIHYIQNGMEYKVELQELETFRGIEQRDQRLLGYIRRVRYLELQNCHKLLNCIPSNMMHLFSHMRRLTARECECLEEIFESNDCEEGDNTMGYELDTIELTSLPKLKHIWKNHGQVLGGYQNLQEIDIKQCHDLKYVFPNVSVATSLPELKFLIVEECNNMEEIIRNDSDSDFPSVQQQQQQPKEAKIIFPSLWAIELEQLPSLKCFCSSSFPCYVELPDCMLLMIKGCREMKTFWPDVTLYAPRLDDLYVDGTHFDKNEDVNEVIRQSVMKWQIKEERKMKKKREEGARRDADRVYREKVK